MSVRIEWVDANSTDTWYRDRQGDFKPTPLSTYGVIINDSNDCITVASTIGEELSCQHFTIPKGCIQRIVEQKDAQA